MAKFRNAMDDEDSEEGGGFRCAECSKCLNCKTSSKHTAISLREAREQQLIEASVKIDVINKKVTEQKLVAINILAQTDYILQLQAATAAEEFWSKNTPKQL